MLGKNIKELRKERGYTQARLAKEIGVTQGAVYFGEKEINEPTAEYLVKLAKIFGVILGRAFVVGVRRRGRRNTA